MDFLLSSQLGCVFVSQDPSSKDFQSQRLNATVPVAFMVQVRDEVRVQIIREEL